MLAGQKTKGSSARSRPSSNVEAVPTNTCRWYYSDECFVFIGMIAKVKVKALSFIILQVKAWLTFWILVSILFALLSVKTSKRDNRTFLAANCFKF